MTSEGTSSVTANPTMAAAAANLTAGRRPQIEDFDVSRLILFL